MYNLGVIGLSPGNGHPYSWSAIFNGFDKDKMARCPFPVIPEYLNQHDPATMCIEEAKVTHIWTQDPAISKDVAGAALIEQVCDNLTDMIGEVDGVLLARDDGERHLEMARPFIEADVPIFIDKPLTDQAEHLPEFIRYYEAGKPLMSCSCMRYSSSLMDLREKKSLGRILTATAITPKYWRTYGIHLIEGIYAAMGSGVQSVQNVGREGEEIVHLLYQDGRHVLLQSFKNAPVLHFCFYGEKGSAIIEETDTYTVFKRSLEKFVALLRTGKSPIDWRETVEMSKVVIAGQKSLEQDGKIIPIDQI